MRLLAAPPISKPRWSLFAAAAMPDPPPGTNDRTCRDRRRPFTAQHAELARLAFLSFGKATSARGSLRRLRPYALAKSTGEPLLFKGTDFGPTDIRSAV